MFTSSTSVAEQYRQVREQTEKLVSLLSDEDMLAQSMPDASPAKWHLAHTTWFFEQFILSEYSANFKHFDPSFSYLFNSYYVSAGQPFERASRGLITRPGVKTVKDYRRSVDEQMLPLLESADSSLTNLCTVGLHHEMQHQELLLTDILHLFAQNPCSPQLFNNEIPVSEDVPLSFHTEEGAMLKVGADKELGFSYDCEQPRHLIYLSPHKLANRLVTNGEWLQFMHDGGYRQPLLWLSDGWEQKEKYGWQAPLYWQEKDQSWYQFGLDGLKKINLYSPVCHVSFYEADAFARWAGKRLPREHELECAAQKQNLKGNFVESENFRPITIESEQDILQVYGDVWEWTQSPYLPYPNFNAEQGALGEYNGKFMVNQFVLKGGSCATARAQMRPSYRNFFHPHQRWQFSGLRLAEDI